MFSTLRAKIFAGYVGILVLLAGLGLYAISTLDSIGSVTSYALELNAQTTVANLTLYASLTRVNEGVLSLLGETDRSDSTTILNQSYEFNDALQKMQRFIASNGGRSTTAIAELLTKIELAWQRYEALLREFYSHSRIDKVAAKGFYDRAMAPAYNGLTILIFELTNKNVRSFNDLRDETTKNAETAVVGVILVTLLALVLGVGASYFLARHITSPLLSLRETLKELQSGNLSTRLPVSGTDEISDVSFEFNRLTERLEEYEAMNIKQILHEKQKSEVVISSINDPLFLFDNSWHLQLANKAAERTVGGLVLRESVSLEETFQDEYLVSMIRGLSKDNQPSSTIPFIISILTGTKLHYYKVGVVSSAGTETMVHGGGFLVIFTDITHFKEVDELRSDLIAKVSHEFRTPLTSLKIALDLLSRSTLGALNKDQHDLIETSKTDTDRLDKLIKDMLAVTKLETSARDTEDIPFIDTGNVFDELIASIRRQYELKQVLLHAERDSVIKLLRIRRLHLESILQNLLSNALKFTSPGGIVTISMHFDPANSTLSIVSKDTGIGIAKEDQDRIFDKFVQIKPADSATPGSVGLGLAIIKETCRQYDGTVFVESVRGEGSIFKVVLPIESIEAV